MSSFNHAARWKVVAWTSFRERVCQRRSSVSPFLQDQTTPKSFLHQASCAHRRGCSSHNLSSLDRKLRLPHQRLDDERLRHHLRMAAPTTNARPRNALFQELPLELRELIYRYVVPLPSSDIFFMPRLCISAADVITGTDPNFPAWLPPIARVSSKTRVDVALYVLRQVEIYVPYPSTIRHLHRFLRTLPSALGQGAIRRLNFPSFGAVRFTKGCGTTYIDFSKSCTQLARLQIGINAPDLGRPCEPVLFAEESSGEVTKDAASIIEAYRLKELIELKGLVSILFELCPLLNGRPVSGVVAEMRSVALLLEGMFAAHDRRVEVLVIDFRGKQWD